MLDKQNENSEPKAEAGEHNAPALLPGLKPENVRMLSWLERWTQTELTDEERQILDDFEAFRREHPFSLASTTDK